MKTVLGDFGIEALASREIDAETAVRLGIYTVSRNEPSGAMVSDAKGRVVAFPFIEHGVEVGCKYRAPGKKFWQRAGARRTFWNADVLDDPLLTSGHAALIITEGEIDALSAIQAGFPLTVSVPDGAPSTAPRDNTKVTPEEEATGKFEFLFNNRDRLKRIKRFVIATDNDAAGQNLAAELVRRLSPARCAFITWPKAAIVGDGPEKRPCKDFNEILMYLGPERLVEIINGAKPYPVRGLYKLSEYPEADELATYESGFPDLALRIFQGEFIVVSGVPGSGKSTWVEDLVTRLAERHDWRCAICSPESRVVPILRDRFRQMRIGYRPMEMQLQMKAEADAWIERHFVFIDTDPTGFGDSDEPFDLEWIVERAVDAVLRDGIRVLVIDPWNEIEHARERGESMVDYIARGIRLLKRFGREYGVTVIVVAHPTKDVADKNGKVRVPSLYDIEGAAHWFNKCDHGIVVHRPDTTTNDTDIHIHKVRFRPQTGRPGTFTFTFDADTGRFS